MNWNNITLQQFQDIYRLSLSTDLDEIEKLTRTICIIHGMTESQVDDLSMSEFNRLGKECAFLLTDKIPGKVESSFRIGLKKYAVNYKPTSLKHRQYVEIVTFGEKPIENMHLIMASLVNRVKWGMKLPNKSEDHSTLSGEMLQAPIVTIYHSCIFFCKLYSDLIKRIRGYLVAEMIAKGMTKESAENLLTISLNAMDGFTTQNK